MALHPFEGPKSDMWRAPNSPGRFLFVYHELGQFGLSHSRWRKLQRAFALPTHPVRPGQPAVPFSHIRYFEEQGNASMERVLILGSLLVVDESMAQWKGRGMPGLMKVPRKPTPVGRETHTTADAETGVINRSKLYEGRERMGEKEYVDQWGKNPSLAMRGVKPWFNSGRTVVADSGFSSVKLAKGLAHHGMYLVGNVKRGHAGFPKQWLLQNVPNRGDKAMATSSFTTSAGETWPMLAAADKDKQPMALLGTAGSSSAGETLTRNFTIIRTDGTYAVRSATLEQMDIHATYRHAFNVVVKNNAKRQGGTSFEDVWKTHPLLVGSRLSAADWDIRSEWLPTLHALSPTRCWPNPHGVPQLTRAMLHHPVLEREPGAGLSTKAANVIQDRRAHKLKLRGRPGNSEGRHRSRGRCRYCGDQTACSAPAAPHQQGGIPLL
eukprot:scaffold608898_cov17-Prasinocladus_malaysianus.AAC.1